MCAEVPEEGNKTGAGVRGTASNGLRAVMCMHCGSFFTICLSKTTVYVKIVDNDFCGYIMRGRKEVMYEAEYQD